MLISETQDCKKRKKGNSTVRVISILFNFRLSYKRHGQIVQAFYVFVQVSYQFAQKDVWKF